MPKFIHSGSNWHVARDADADFRDVLPPGNYIVEDHPFHGFSLTAIAPFGQTSIYGNTKKHAERILRTYRDRNCNTGVLAVGDKGTGKTLLTRLVAIQAASDYGMPTLIVGAKFGGEEFNTFLATIEQPTIVLFDEFEKVYDRDEQEQLLTLFDGVHQSNKLFLFTANEQFGINDCLLSRPGRIFYYLEFGPLESLAVQEYCAEHLLDLSQVPEILAIAETYGRFSFDVLQALVQEMNRYDESPQDALRYLNLQLTPSEERREYILTVRFDGEEISNEAINNRHWMINFAETRFRISIQLESTSDGENQNYVILDICPENVFEIREGGSIIIYRNKGYEVMAKCTSSDAKFDAFKFLNQRKALTA